MKISVTIIAHNEERNIEKCITSVFDQTSKPDEIIVVCHNCSDKTENIVRKFKGIKVVRLNSPAGVVYARIKAYESVSPDTDIIASTDGDSFMNRRWLENLLKPFSDQEVVATGGVIFFTNSAYANGMSLSFFPLSLSFFSIQFQKTTGQDFSPFRTLPPSSRAWRKVTQSL